MMGARDLPFKVGGQAESRSFITGFRGAWFRCKVKLLPALVCDHIFSSLSLLVLPKTMISKSLSFFAFLGLACYICYLCGQ